MSNPLNLEWTVSYRNPDTDKEETIPARVPGNIIGDLERAGKIEDPYYGTNSERLRNWEYCDFVWRSSFRVEKPGRYQLVFEGIDTLSEITLNGKLLGKTENMFIPHRFEAEFEQTNELTVKIFSVINEARKRPLPALANAQEYNYESLYLRKAGHSFGWDIAPRLLGAGLWRNVCLEEIPEERWTDVYLGTAKATSKKAEMICCWNFVGNRERFEGYSGILEMRHGDSVVRKEFPVYFSSGKFAFALENPHLWYPNGYGDHPLYDVRLTLNYDGKKVAVKEWKQGVRTIRLLRRARVEEKSGRNFSFEVNGERIFIRGSNWVPANAVHGERRERILKSLSLFTEIGCNMIRCWGGGVYESHEFFDYCDRNGLMVWQDFMFGCVVLPQDEFLLKQVKVEAETVVKELRNHASLALWSGNNENDAMLKWCGSAGSVLPSYDRVSREILPNAVALNDPLRDYLPSSPYLSDEIWNAGELDLAPEQHLWGPRAYWKTPFYKDSKAVFASEIGYHGMNVPESVKKFIPESSWNGRVGDPNWNCHAAQPFGDPDGVYSYRIKLMVDQVKTAFGFVPETLEDFSLASQIIQAEAMKFFVETFRMKKGEKTGLIWWNVIDCWPQFSDAVVDFYYEKKLAWHFIKESQQNVLLMLGEANSWTVPLVGVNDTSRPVAGNFRVTDLNGTEYATDTFELPANGNAETVAELRLDLGIPRMYRIEWETSGRKFTNHYRTGSIPMDLKQYREDLKKMGF